MQSRFQSLSREKPFCHDGKRMNRRLQERLVSIAQSRKALLPLSSNLNACGPRACKFQSLSREKPFCHTYWVCKQQYNVTLFQSLSREKPFCHCARSFLAVMCVPSFQSLSREKPFCHPCRDLFATLSMFSFNRSVAKSPSATHRDCLRRAPPLWSFNRSVAKSPSATEWSARRAAEYDEVSIAQSRKALLPPT